MPSTLPTIKLRLPSAEAYAQLQRKAAAAGLSVNSFVLRALQLPALTHGNNRASGQRRARRLAEIAALTSTLAASGRAELGPYRATRTKRGDYRVQVQQGAQWARFETGLSAAEAADVLWCCNHSRTEDFE